MALIRPLLAVTPADLNRLITGYESDAKYVVTRSETAARVIFQIEWATLPTPYRKQYEPLDEATVQRYGQVAQLGFSFGVDEGERLIGLALAEPHGWNQSLWVWEFHLEKAQRRRGLGRQLMEALAEKAQAAGLRIIVCETQNTNAPAIEFYRKVGFAVEGIDVSYYTNADLGPEGEVAVFMKRRLKASSHSAGSTP